MQTERRDSFELVEEHFNFLRWSGNGKFVNRLYSKMIQSASQGDTLGPREKSVLWTLLKFTLAMIILPISCFFLSKKMVFEDVLGYENGSIGAATITVIVVHVIIGLYIWVAIQEEQWPKPLKKD
ncbi:vacuolar ATPase assembly integral membrane protein VMA21-like [Orbicella faveolata]|uniref:vacuolar ATPase assembly integral membrane protein VMA21-like n=1 Tax=Orbicella faveolata TaxID=48498 RepID=UPI0009E44932|nr:vacuolar ATPase assembly integral membrane protein VMA21-like [Orbicella faveolata]